VLLSLIADLVVSPVSPIIKQAARGQPSDHLWSVMHQISPQTSFSANPSASDRSPRLQPPCTSVAAVSCACLTFHMQRTWRGTSSSPMSALLSHVISSSHLRPKPVRQQHRLDSSLISLSPTSSRESATFLPSSARLSTFSTRADDPSVL
jgi:hypothetical protein